VSKLLAAASIAFGVFLAYGGDAGNGALLAVMGGVLWGVS
jgi:uncharacterized membrane protein